MRSIPSAGSSLPYWLIVGCLACWAGLLIPCRRTMAQAETTSVDAERAMRLVESTSWYDGGRGGYQPPSVVAEKDNPLRKNGWLKSEEGRSSAGGASGSGAAGSAWNFGFGLFGGDWISGLVLLLLGGVLAAIIVLLLFHSYRSYLPHRYRQPGQPKKVEIDPAKITDLPFETDTVADADPLQRAHRCIQEGEFRQAVVLLYAYQLLALDQRRKIDLQRGKTNRMYLRELRTNSSLSLEAMVKKAMSMFEEVYFGDHEISPQAVNSLWQDLDSFHRELDTGPSENLSGNNHEVVPT